MPQRLKTNSVMVLALAGVLYAFFMFAKHDRALSAVVPFLNDPYDAIGSFAVILSGLLGVLACARAFRPYRAGPTAEEKVFLVRTQMAIVLAVLITIASDVMAMMRYPSTWLGKARAQELLLLIAGMTALAAVAAVLVRRSLGDEKVPSGPRERRNAVMISAACMVVLALYPRSPGILGALLAAAIGSCLLFLSMSALLVVLVPQGEGAAGSSRKPGHQPRSWIPWVGIALLGAAVGTFALLGEAMEGSGGIPPARLVLVASVFLGMGTLGLLVAFACLRKPLGLFR